MVVSTHIIQMRIVNTFSFMYDIMRGVERIC